MIVERSAPPPKRILPEIDAAARIDAFAARIRGLPPRQRYGLALGLGLLTAGALPPVGVVPVLLLTLPGLVWLLDGSGGIWRAFAAGWWFGLGFFAAGFYWISEAFLVNPERFAWMIPFALTGLCGWMALFTGVAAAVAWRVSGPGLGRVLALAGAWTLAEGLRGWVLTGFPWNLMAYVWSGSAEMMQAAAVVGAFGVSLLTVAAMAMPAVLANTRMPAWRRRGGAVAGAALLMALVWVGGAVRLANIPQTMKWQPALRERQFLRQIGLSRSPGFATRTVVIWPETASVFALNVDDEHRARIAAAAPPGGFLITGALRVTPPRVDPYQVWNSLFVLDAGASLIGVYDKSHLVPLGEYVPLRSVLPLEKITESATDFSAGPGPRTVVVPGLPAFSPLICYEVIFPGHVVNPDQRPEWLLNITNDSWFGHSAGPYQHFASARWRAVEEGLPLVRSAGGGISAVVDAYGRVVARLELGARGVLDSPLPESTPTLPLFARWGNDIAWAVAIIFIITGFAIPRRG
ncbi:MAG: apolipoprotein N-acyltransferase [Alphaproteobacteria bacterium]|nr:apolipoprotein N-acyltransferase [Alphaproteobacteria bacterium]